MMNRWAFKWHLKCFLSILIGLAVLSACQDQDFVGVSASRSDDLLLMDGLEAEVLIKWTDPISKTDYFGYDNSGLVFFESPDGDPFLIVGHESVEPAIVSGYDEVNRTRLYNQITIEQYQVGVSVVKLGGWWRWKAKGHLINKRLTAQTSIPYANDNEVLGQKIAPGTAAIADGVATPWGTVLLAENQYNYAFGDQPFASEQFFPSKLQWESFTGNSPLHFGWIVELDPLTGVANKWISAGRFRHGGLALMQDKFGNYVLYSGDDSPEGCLYKYVMSGQSGMSSGQLFVANVSLEQWVPVDFAHLAFNFENEIDVQIYTSEAGRKAGGSPIGNLAGIAAHPVSAGTVSIASRSSSAYTYGAIYKLTELSDNRFKWETDLLAGEPGSLVHPSLLKYDASGNLWIGSAISSEELATADYESFGNNALFVRRKSEIPSQKLLRVMQAPIGAQFGGLCFSPDNETCFISVQHPGAGSSKDVFTSHWPEGGSTKPKPAVVMVEGDFLETIQD